MKLTFDEMDHVVDVLTICICRFAPGSRKLYDAVVEVRRCVVERLPDILGLEPVHPPAHLRTDFTMRASANPSRASTCARSKISS